MSLTKISFFALLMGGLSIITSSCGGDADESQGGKDSTEVADLPKYDIGVNFVHDDTVPAECQVMDAYLDCHYWTDVNGGNYFLRSLGFPTESEQRGKSGDPRESQLIYAYHYRETSDGISLLHEYRDSIVNCDLDIIMSHVKGCFFVTDIDEDEMAEFTYMYRMTCTDEVSPSTQVLKMVEGHDVYTLIGESLVFEEGGDYEIGPEFENAPEGFQEHATGIWDDFKDELTTL